MPGFSAFIALYYNTVSTAEVIQGDQKVSMHLTITVHTNDELRMAIREHIRNVDRAVLNKDFENSSACQ